jgi:hypothetical protein
MAFWHRWDREFGRHRDPLIDVYVGDDGGGMPAEFVDLPENEPGAQYPPTVVERVVARRETDEQ